MQGLDSPKTSATTSRTSTSKVAAPVRAGTAFTIRGLPNSRRLSDGVWQVGTLRIARLGLHRSRSHRGVARPARHHLRSRIGGAIRMWTRPPGEEFGGQLTVTTGSYDHATKASLDLPITDTLRTKWTGSSLYREGFVEGITTGVDYGLLDQDTLRGDVVWEPTDRLARFVSSLTAKTWAETNRGFRTASTIRRNIPAALSTATRSFRTGVIPRSSGLRLKAPRSAAFARYRPFHRELPGRLSGR